MAYEEVRPEYWHTVVMGRGSNPVTVMDPLRGLHGRDQAWNHYLVNEFNWLKYYREARCADDLPELENLRPLIPSRVRTRDRTCRTFNEFPRSARPWCPEHWNEVPESVRQYYIEQDAIAKEEQARREAAARNAPPPGGSPPGAGPPPGPKAKAPPTSRPDASSSAEPPGSSSGAADDEDSQEGKGEGKGPQRPLPKPMPKPKAAPAGVPPPVQYRGTAPPFIPEYLKTSVATDGQQPGLRSVDRKE